jgi:hypothetical protein
LSSSDSDGSRLLRECATETVDVSSDVLDDGAGVLELGCTKAHVKKRRLRTSIVLTVIVVPLIGMNTVSNVSNSVAMLSPVIDAAK